MNTNVGSPPGGLAAPTRPRLDHKPGKGAWATVALLLLAGLGCTAFSITTGYAGSGERSTAIWPFVLPGMALLIALGFEFVNGSRDTASAVANVIHTNSLPPHVTVVWSGVAVAMAGWKRIVVTVGEKMGKPHLTFIRGPRP